MKKLVTIGCSFTYGIGLNDRLKSVYGKIVADNLNLEHVNLAEPGASNIYITLQGEYALENIRDIDTVLIGVTSLQRFITTRDNFQFENNTSEIEPITYQDFKENKVVVENVKSLEVNRKYVNKHRLNSFKNYLLDLYCPNSKAAEDYFSLSFIVEKFLQKGIKVVILCEASFFTKYFSLYTLPLNFFRLSIYYPDTFGTSHLSEEGHLEVSKQILKFIKT